MKQIVSIVVGFVFLLVGCTQTSNKDAYTNPVIKAGTARISGKVHGYTTTEEVTLRLFIPNPVTGVSTIIETIPDKDGLWSFETPTEFNPVFGSLSFTFGSDATNTAISFYPEKELHIDFNKDETGSWKSEIVEGSVVFTQDANYWSDLIMQMYTWNTYTYINQDSVLRYAGNLQDYASFIMKYSIEKRLDIVRNDTLISEQGRNYVTNEMKFVVLDASLMDYEETLEMMFINVKDPKDDTTRITIKQPDKSYYSFLKEFDLNNPVNLYNASYYYVSNGILTNETLNIPSIGEMPVDEWMTTTKDILADLVGFNDGLFYDILAGNSYSRQFNNQLKPLSDKQKQNIQEYYGNNEIAKILIRKSEEVSLLANSKGALCKNETPDVSNNELLEAIVSKYKGKIVFVDFWATWCGPCLQGMKDIRPLKAELMKRDDIVFVYITNETSPQTQWIEKIEGIGGEHYYLKNDEWESVLNKYGFSGIPTYMFFDKNGELKEQMTGYPGNDRVKEIIQGLQ